MVFLLKKLVDALVSRCFTLVGAFIESTLL